MSRKSRVSAASEASRTGRRPNRSDNPPTTGENTNWASANPNVASPPQKAARPTPSPVRSIRSDGRTGMINANASASISTVPTTNMVAAARG